MPSRVEAESLLAIDVGSVNTRAALFDVVEGRYRLIAIGNAPCTADSPYFDVREGVRLALDQLQGITGRALIDSNQELILPSREDGSGVDGCVATFSVGRPLKIVIVGLLESVSVESALHLAQTIPAEVLETISLNDRRRPDGRLNVLMRAHPDVVVIAGGSDGGASQSVLRLLEIVALAAYLRQSEQRLEVLYVGNSALHQAVKETFRHYAHLHFASNVRPTLEQEHLDPAHIALSHLSAQWHCHQISGLTELDSWAKGNLLPTSTAFGRVIRFLGQEVSSTKGVLGVDLGASTTTLAVGRGGALTLHVFPNLGIGQTLANLPTVLPVHDILRWLPFDSSEDEVLDYLHNKALYPATLPQTAQELSLEQTLARLVLASALQATPWYQASDPRPARRQLPPFEVILASGSTLTQAPHLGQAALILLDGLQPVGITSLVLDQHQILPALGAAAALNPVLTVQVLESNAFVQLGTVIAPQAKVRYGTPVLRIKMTYESGHQIQAEVKQGTIEVLPLPRGQTARLQLYPLHRADVGMGARGRGGSLKVNGGALGVIVDARGRPFLPPREAPRRRELYHKWLVALGEH